MSTIVNNGSAPLAFSLTVNGLEGASTTTMQPSIEPLPPVVTATKSGNSISITETVYINAADNVTSLNIYTVGTGTTLQVFIDYNYEEVIPASLKSYTFTFTVDIGAAVINNISSYLFDEDPIGSRGTVTTVDR